MERRWSRRELLYLPARDAVKKADPAIAPDKLAALLRGELRRTGMVLSTQRC